MPRRSIRLADKAKILIAVPLMCGLIFVTILFLAVKHAESEAKEAERARDVFSYGSIITTSLLEGFQSLVRYRYIPDEENAQAYSEQMNRLQKAIQQLHKLLKDKPKDLKRLKDLEELCNLGISHMNEAKRLIEMGGDVGGDMHKVDEHAKDLKHLIGKLEARLQQLISPYQEQGAKASVAQRQFRDQIVVLVFFGVGANILVAVLLATGFNRGTLNQLMVLMDNIGRMRSGEKLNPVLDGTDELSQLDQVFHMMAQTVSDQTEELKLSEARVRAVIEGLPMGVAVLNEDHSIRFLNPAAETLFGRESEELSGWKMSQLLNDPKKKKGMDELERDIIVGARDHVKEFRGLRRDGEEIPLEISAREFQGPEGTMHLLGLVDVTERHAIEQMKQEFVAMVTHDLRSPLTSIRLSSELMFLQFENEMNDEWRRLLRVQDENCTRLIGLVNDLLDLDKLEAGMMQLELEPVALQKCFDQTKASINSLALTKGIAIAWGPTDIELVADPDRIVQVLVNLVSNSIKFSERGQTIELVAENKDSWIEISIIDHGRGIPADKVGTIFERFTQVKKEDATKKGGTGLGLAICKSIVESHKGQIGVESEEGEGCRFWFRIPAYSEQADPDLD